MAIENSISDSAWIQPNSVIRDAYSSLNKELNATLNTIGTLNNTKAILRVEAKQAKEELSKAQKQFDATGTAADKMKLNIASVKFDNITKNISFLSGETQKAKSSINDLINTASKADNRGFGGILKDVSESDLGKMAIDTGLDVATAHFSSAFGSNAGNIFNKTVSSAIVGGQAGAAIGTAILPVIGTAIGAGAGTLIGGTLGYISGKTDEFKDEDETYKAKVRSETKDAIKNQENDLIKGEALSSQRQDDLFDFENLTKNDESAKLVMSDVTDLSSKIPMHYNELAATAKTLMHYGYGQSNMKSMLVNLSDAGAGLGLDGNGINQLAAYIGKLSQGKGKKITEADLSALEASGVDIWKYVSRENVNKGSVTADMAVSKILEGLKKDYAGKMDKKGKTINGLKIIDSNLDEENLVAEGNAYNENSANGIKKKIDFKRENADNFQKSSEQTGSSNGVIALEVDNNYIDQMGQLFNSSIFKDAINSKDKNVGFLLDNLMRITKIKADDKTEQSEIKQDKEKAQLDLICQIQVEIGSDSKNYMFAKKVSDSFSKGLDSIKFSNKPDKPLQGMAYQEPAKANVSNKLYKPSLQGMVTAKSNATGIFRVPYNNFPALLHEGETVHTAVEARSAKREPTVTITGNNFVVREEADIDKIARAFVEKLTKASAVLVAS